jgi:hypothetical protein
MISAPVMKKVSFIIIFFAIALLISQPMLAQESRWLFIGRNDNGSTSYLEKSALKETGNEKRTWVKEVYNNRSKSFSLTGNTAKKDFVLSKPPTTSLPGNTLIKREVRYGKPSCRIRLPKATSEWFVF